MDSMEFKSEVENYADLVTSCRLGQLVGFSNELLRWTAHHATIRPDCRRPELVPIYTSYYGNGSSAAAVLACKHCGLVSEQFVTTDAIDAVEAHGEDVPPVAEGVEQPDHLVGRVGRANGG